MIHRIQAKNIRTLSKPSKNSGILLKHANVLSCRKKAVKLSTFITWLPPAVVRVEMVLSSVRTANSETIFTNFQSV